MQNNALLRWYASKLDSHPLRTKIITSGFIAGTGDLLCQSIGLGMEKPVDDANNDNKHHSTAARYDITRTIKFAFLGATLVAPATHVWYGYLMTTIPGTNVLSVGKRLAFDQGLFAPLFLTTFVSSLTVLDHVVAASITNFMPTARILTSTMAEDTNNSTTNDPNHCQVDNAKSQPLLEKHRQVVPNNNPHSPKMEGYTTSSSSSSSSTPIVLPPPSDPSSLQSLICTRIQNDVPQSLIVGWSIWIPSMAYMFAYVPGKYQVLFSNSVGFVWNVYLSWRTHQ